MGELEPAPKVCRREGSTPLLRKEKKGTDLCAPGKAWSPGNDGASRHEMA
uniref:Uncharacterized protein n=1 Tax=Pseudomonas aeruginosa TaxID=287 RepID=A0A7S5YBP1_PSEAI|nr:hypothetical protein [Pseudomonas aeruginosa]QNI17673.1 hypothetical protein [Pseudomonas aeruginosa]